MAMIYKKASADDLYMLLNTRLEVLRAANHLQDNTELPEVKAESESYYKRALADGTHTAYLVFDGDVFAGAGGISFYQVMPTVHNPSGKKAYIMNMYTHPDYRRRGIASKMLDLLAAEARERGIAAISLEATEMGRALYEKYGFIQMKNELELPQG